MRKKENHISGDSVCSFRYYMYPTTDFTVAIDMNPNAGSRGTTQSSEIQSEACFSHMQAAPRARCL